MNKPAVKLALSTIEHSQYFGERTEEPIVSTAADQKEIVIRFDVEELAKKFSLHEENVDQVAILSKEAFVKKIVETIASLKNPENGLSWADDMMDELFGYLLFEGMDCEFTDERFIAEKG